MANGCSCVQQDDKVASFLLVEMSKRVWNKPRLSKPDYVFFFEFMRCDMYRSFWGGKKTLFLVHTFSKKITVQLTLIRRHDSFVSNFSFKMTTLFSWLRPCTKSTKAAIKAQRSTRKWKVTAYHWFFCENKTFKLKVPGMETPCNFRPRAFSPFVAFCY